MTNKSERLPSGVYHVSEVIAELLATLTKPEPENENIPPTKDTASVVFKASKKTEVNDGQNESK